MALPVNIEDLINARTVESVRIEFKRGWNPYDIIRTVCAFANDIDELGGGYIVIGIEEDNGSPILPPFGIEQKDLDGIQREFFKLCQNNLSPNLFPPIEIIEFQGKYIIVIWITTGEQRPYQASNSPGKNAKMAKYVRHGSVTKEANEQQIRQLQELARVTHFDDRVNLKASINDLDLGLIQSYLQESKSNLYEESLKLSLQEIALKMQIARGPKENIRPLNVALLMFCKEPEKFFAGCKTNLVEFEDEAGIEYSEKIFTGPVHIQIRDIMNYLKNNIIIQNVKKSFEKAESQVHYNYPYQALEEVIVNAMYHRSYEEQRPNEIRIYKYFKKEIDKTEDSRRIEIRSYPGPLPPIDSQALIQLNFNSRGNRNIKLGDLLKNIRLAEKYATGIPTILQSLSENGSPQPLFWTDDDKTEFLVKINIHQDTPLSINPNKEVIEIIPLSNLQQQILERLKEEPTTLRKIKKTFKNDISNEISYLEENKFIGVKKELFYDLIYITQKGLDSLKFSF